MGAECCLLKSEVSSNFWRHQSVIQKGETG